MKKVLTTFLGLLGLMACNGISSTQNGHSASSSSGHELTEFSTSMSYDEFSVVVRHIDKNNGALAGEITRFLEEFKVNSAVGDRSSFDLEESQGQMTLYLDDIDTIEIWIITNEEVNEILNDAYDIAVQELGI